MKKVFCKKNDFELQIFRLVTFWINSSTTRQILSWKIVQRVRI